MTQRSPMNERNQREGQGSTRKSAASMKPKSKAAASVRIQPKEKTKEQKKADKRAARQRQAELDRKYYNPPTEEYKRLRRIYWVLMVVAIVCVVVSFAGRGIIPDTPLYVILGLAYVAIIAALYFDLVKIRRVRRKYQEEAEAHKSKAARAAEKKEKASAKAKEAEPAASAAEAGEGEGAEKPKKKGLFGRSK